MKNTEGFISLLIFEIWKIEREKNFLEISNKMNKKGFKSLPSF